MRISDWSSDVCSSDLLAVVAFDPPCLLGRQLVLPAAGATGAEEALAVDRALDEALLRLQLLKLLEGRELDRSPDARLVGRDAEVAGHAPERDGRSAGWEGCGGWCSTWGGASF